MAGLHRSQYRIPSSLSMMSILVGVIVITVFVCPFVCAIQNELEYDIDEEVSIGSPVGDIFVDAGVESKYGPTISKDLYIVFADPTAPNVDLFTLEDGKVLKTAKRIDRDTLCPSLEVCKIQLTLHLQPDGQFQILRVTLLISDTNDNIPKFSSPIETTSLSEAASDGTKVALTTATDPDSPVNGIKGYEIVDPLGLFRLEIINDTNEIALYLVLRGKLDRETKERYNVDLFAYEGVPGTNALDRNRFGKTTIEIRVLDINDNLPEFNQQVYPLTTPEDTPRYTRIIQVKAVDKDSGANAVVRYSFDDKTQQEWGTVFAIDSSVGNITLTDSLDHETKKSITLIVQARNKDDSSQAVSAKVVITVTDVNDNPPVIKVHGLNTEGEVFKSESATNGDFVAHVKVTDPDSGVNGVFNCSLLNSNEFRLEQQFDTDYIIVTKAPLDRETRSQYYLDLTCTDTGTPRKSSSQYITVRISDENDNVPMFTRPLYGESILENNARGIPVTQVQAYDRDSENNGVVRYRFKDDSVIDKLDIDPVTGNITAKVSFDHETIQRLEFQIVAYDLGEPESKSSTTSVLINIFDVDDELPEFSKKAYSFWVYENQSIKTLVGQINASDADSKPFNQFTLTMQYGPPDAEKFDIESTTGKLYTTEELNRENQDTYNFVVMAVTSGIQPRTSSVEVTVHVADINDNPPVITYPNQLNNTIYVSSAEPVENIISYIIAHDIDTMPNSELLYKIVSGNDEGFFLMDPVTGAISIHKDLSTIDHQVFGLVISVTDKGLIPRTSESFLNIIVNRSLGHRDSLLMTNQNLTIVIVIATISGLLMVVLMVAILVLVRWPRILACNKKLKYNYVARAADKRLAPTSSSAAYEKQNNLKANNNLAKLEAGDDSGFSNLSFTDGKDEEKMLDTSGQFVGTTSKLHIEIPDKDVDSMGSGSGSMGTDSGRGSNEDVMDPPPADGIPHRIAPTVVPTRPLPPGVHRPQRPPSRNSTSTHAHNASQPNGHVTHQHGDAHHHGHHHTHHHQGHHHHQHHQQPQNNLGNQRRDAALSSTSSMASSQPSIYPGSDSVFYPAPPPDRPERSPYVTFTTDPGVGGLVPAPQRRRGGEGVVPPRSAPTTGSYSNGSQHNTSYLDVVDLQRYDNDRTKSAISDEVHV